MSAETASTTNVVEDEHHDDRPRYDDINTGVIFLIGVITTIVTIITIAFVQGLTYHWESKLQEETSYEVVDTPAKAEVDSQKANLQYDPATGAIFNRRCNESGLGPDSSERRIARDAGWK